MAVIHSQPAARELRTPVRNRYFHGKLLDAYHFQLESDYMNAKRHLLNRLVSGYGVVCGLDVKCEPDSRHIVIEAGVAIDKWGREIVVPERTRPIPIPPYLLAPSDGDVKGYDQSQKQGGGKGDERPEDDEGGFRVMLCYHECESDPVPVVAGDCGTVEECAPGSIRERYRVLFKEGAAPPIRPHCRVPDLFRGDRFDYEALARHVSEACPAPPADPCIPLANLRPGADGCDPDRIDITIRPIVYTNDLLFEIILSLLEEGRDRRAK
ncbi:MAG TPA: hypothetical protein VIL35_10390 [Vicinamibacterales bacterium]